MELARATGHPHQDVRVELERLVAAGLVRVALIQGRRQYEPETDDPIARALASFVHQTRGRVPALRRLLEQMRPRSLAWLTCAPGVSSNGSSPHALVVLTGAPRRVVHARLGPMAGPDLAIRSMTIAEWVTCLQKGELFARRTRRGPKLWVLGSPEELVRWEQQHHTSRATLEAALRDWREQLSDDWDDGWDPDAPDPEIAR